MIGKKIVRHVQFDSTNLEKHAHFAAITVSMWNPIYLAVSSTVALSSIDFMWMGIGFHRLWAFWAIFIYIFSCLSSLLLCIQNVLLTQRKETKGRENFCLPIRIELHSHSTRFTVVQRKAKNKVRQITLIWQITTGCLMFAFWSSTRTVWKPKVINLKRFAVANAPIFKDFALHRLAYFVSFLSMQWIAYLFCVSCFFSADSENWPLRVSVSVPKLLVFSRNNFIFFDIFRFNSSHLS